MSDNPIIPVLPQPYIPLPQQQTNGPNSTSTPADTDDKSEAPSSSSPQPAAGYRQGEKYEKKLKNKYVDTSNNEGKAKNKLQEQQEEEPASLADCRRLLKETGTMFSQQGVPLPTAQQLHQMLLHTYSTPHRRAIYQKAVDDLTATTLFDHAVNNGSNLSPSASPAERQLAKLVSQQVTNAHISSAANALSGTADDGVSAQWMVMLAMLGTIQCLNSEQQFSLTIMQMYNTMTDQMNALFQNITTLTQKLSDAQQNEKDNNKKANVEIPVPISYLPQYMSYNMDALNVNGTMLSTNMTGGSSYSSLSSDVKKNGSYLGNNPQGLFLTMNASDLSAQSTQATQESETLQNRSSQQSNTYQNEFGMQNTLYQAVSNFLNSTNQNNIKLAGNV